jgi:hypothetical protein
MMRFAIVRVKPGITIKPTPAPVMRRRTVWSISKALGAPTGYASRS